jgi:hypothetical protein
LEAAFILLEFPSPSRRIFIGSHSLPPLWFAVSVLHRQPEGVLGAVLVEVGVVDAHPPLVGVLLADEDGVGEPLRMEYFSDEASRE